MQFYLTMLHLIENKKKYLEVLFGEIYIMYNALLLHGFTDKNQG